MPGLPGPVRRPGPDRGPRHHLPGLRHPDRGPLGPPASLAEAARRVESCSDRILTAGAMPPDGAIPSDRASERTRPSLAFYYDPDRKGWRFFDVHNEEDLIKVATYFCGVVLEYRDP